MLALELGKEVVVQRVLLSNESPHCWVIEEAVSLILIFEDIDQGGIAPMAGTVLPAVACQASAKAHGGEGALEQVHLELSQVFAEVMEYVGAYRTHKVTLVFEVVQGAGKC